MTTTPEPSNPDEPAPPPIGDSSNPDASDQLLHRARHILAEQRGMNARSRLMLEAAAAELGLTKQQLDAVIATIQNRPRESDLASPASEQDILTRSQLRRDRKRKVTSRGMAGVAVAAGIGGMLALAGFLGWRVILNGRQSRQQTTPPAETENGMPLAADQWWTTDEGLATAITLTRIEMPVLHELISDLDSAELNVRARAYQKLIQIASRDASSQQQWLTMRALIGGCFAFEPSDYCADRIAGELVTHIPGTKIDGGWDKAWIDRTFWAVATIAAALENPRLSQAREELLIDKISDRIQSPVHAAGDSDLPTAVAFAVCQHLFGLMTDAADDDPIKFGALFFRSAWSVGALPK